MAVSTTKAAGIDIGKAYLDVALHPSGETVRLPNDPDGCRRLIDWLQAHDVSRVGLEASGGYERNACDCLGKAGFAVARLQPRQVRAFATYRLRLAKNDRLDAALIAECTAALETVRERPDPRFAPLAEHLRLIEQIETDLARLKTRAEAYHATRLKRWLTRESTRLERQLKAELALLAKTVAQHEDLTERLRLIESVDGVGRRTALALLILMPELGHIDAGQAASLAGLAPFDRESGKWSGNRRIQGGRHRVRRSLFAAALPASFRWNPALVNLYQRLRAKGKAHKQALIACARKLLIFVNTVLKRRTQWASAR